MTDQQQQPQLDEVVGADGGVGVGVGDQVHGDPGEQNPVLGDHHDQGDGHQQGVQGAGALVEQPGGPKVGDQPVGLGGNEGGEGDKVNQNHGGAKSKVSAQKKVKGVEPPPFMLSRLLGSKEFLHLAASRIESSVNLDKIIDYFHQQVFVTPQGQRGPSFLVRMLYKLGQG